MEVSIHDREALLAVSPVALSAYARASGWRRGEPYRRHSDVYAGAGLPEILIPRNDNIADYASAVAALIAVFAEVADQDQLTVYRELVTADRDVIRVRAVDGEHDGSLPVDTGAALVSRSRDMVLAAACSLGESRPVYRAGANKEAVDYLRQVRLGQTEQGSFVVSLLSPVVSPPMQMSLMWDLNELESPLARRVTARLTQALDATRQATDDTNRGKHEAFPKSVDEGVSANLCDALAGLTGALSRIDVNVVWARTHLRDDPRWTVRFTAHDTPILLEASRVFRSHEPQPDIRLTGLVQVLKRDESASEGTVTLRTSIERQNRSVKAVLPQSEYLRAIEAHKAREPVVMRGDLEKAGRDWRLLNPRIEDVIANDEAAGEGDAGDENDA